MKKRRVFISHSGQDTWVAKRIAEGVRNANAIPFLDAENLHIGEKVGESIFSSLLSIDEFLVLFTPWAMNRKYIWFELGGAWTRLENIQTVIVLYGISGIEFSSAAKIPKFLKRLRRIYLNEIDSYFDELKRRKGPILLGKPSLNIQVPPGTPDAFVSCSTNDIKLLTELDSALQSKGVIPWMRPKLLSAPTFIPGEELELGIQGENALVHCELYILILSESSVSDPLVFFELGAAYANKKEIQIFRIDQLPDDKIPPFLFDFYINKEASTEKIARKVFEQLDLLRRKNALS